MNGARDTKSPHDPVMVAEVLHYLALQPGAIVVDATLGSGGHARRLLNAVGPAGLLIGLDRDPQMAAMAKAALTHNGAGPARFYQANYSDLGEVLRRAEVEAVDGLLMDLGACSVQLDDPSRGFSYREDGPLAMAMTPEEGLTAEDLVNDLPEAQLEAIIHEFGEERWARRIARQIVAARARQRLTRTGELVEAIQRAVPPGPRRLHPARRTFQALRIATNQEIRHLEAALAAVPRFLRPGGRLVVLSYHSLEDRPVKHALRAGAAAGYYRILTPRVVTATAAEVARNPRARSAKLRAAEYVGPPPRRPSIAGEGARATSPPGGQA